MPGALPALLLAIVLGAPAARPSPAPRGPAASEAPRARLVAAARRHLARPFAGDCSGFVRRVFADARVPLRLSTSARSGTEAIVAALPRARRPRPGDLAFFHRTHDGATLFTHVAIVESVRGARVSLVHRSNTGVERLRLDLARRDDPAANDPLRRRRPGDPPGVRYLASQLLGGFASPFGGARAPVAARAARTAAAARTAR